MRALLATLLMFGAASVLADDAGHEHHGDHVAVAPAALPPPAPTPPSTAQTAPAHQHTSSSAPDMREEPRTMIEVPAVQQSRIGLLTAKLASKRVAPTLRVVGAVQIDERRQAEVHSRVAGFIESLFVNTVGQQVQQGQLLYRIYSPDIVATQEEFVAGRGQGEIGEKVSNAALARLSLWEVSPREIFDLEQTGAVRKSLGVEAPVTGAVIDKNAVLGMYVTPEMTLFRIADLRKIWIVASLFETELALVKVGDRVEVSLPSEPGKTIHASVSYLYPEMDVATRTGKARIDVDNADGLLKPGMYATIGVTKDLGDVLVVPADAVIDTGARKLVFVQTAETRFEPRAVVLGPRIGDDFVVLSGVADGDEVVVRASFLIDAESRLQAALKTGAGPQGHAGHGH